ncbi:hypothetical protein BaRGS_00006344 [Batillaria attramentaria]|uniref:G-protein coupled receptors family 1 profile domain-containing protein n=1 Tax=Batillaria attramentaria TaxID=370345 RepID=A0ABD0LSD5_9CAEN
MAEDNKEEDINLNSQSPGFVTGRGNTTEPWPENLTSTAAPSSQNFTLPEGCVVLQFEDFIPWDNEDNLISAEFEQFFHRVVTGWVLPMIFLIGGPTNVMNMVVFYKLGLKERINVCLFSLSLADELYMIRNMLLDGERIYTQFTTGNRDGPLAQFVINNNLIGFVGFTWVSQIISAIIASERCFCIVSPLHSQTVLKTRTTAIFIATCFIVVVGLCFVVATRYRVMCVYDPLSGAVTDAVGSSEFYFQHQKFIDYLDSVVYGVTIPGAALVTVTLTTIVTAVKLRQVVAKRADMSSSKISAREVAVTRMLICNSILFIVCVFPIFFFRLILFFVPELNSGRRYHNTFLTVLWVLDVVAYINSSFNFFIYYKMGSRYRETFKELFCKRRCLRNQTIGNSREQELHQPVPSITRT